MTKENSFHSVLRQLYSACRSSVELGLCGTGVTLIRMDLIIFCSGIRQNPSVEIGCVDSLPGPTGTAHSIDRLPESSYRV